MRTGRYLRRSSVAAAAACSSLVLVTSAVSTTDFCTSIGLSKAAVQKVFGHRETVELSPNSGSDTGTCLVYHLKSFGPGANVELYAAGQEPSIVAIYQQHVKTKQRLSGLGPGALLETGPAISGATNGGPNVYFSTPSYYVTITGNAKWAKQPGATAAQVISLARVIYRAVG